MTSRERLKTIISGKPADRCGFWLGHPHAETWPIYHAYFKTTTPEELRRVLHDDFRWIPVGAYRDADRKGFFPIPNKSSHGFAGPLADCTDPEQIESAYDWPNPDLVDFAPALAALKTAGDFYRASGTWTPFYHIVMDLFGMENYLANMYENPPIVQAVTDKVCRFFHTVNTRFFEVAGREMDGFFFGNDFGTQLDTICGPDQFDQFVMPWFNSFTELAHSYGHQVILHSCGSVHRVIDRLICAKVDCLHPLQARAKNMNAERLSEDFKGQIAFLGGIDTQDLLVNGTPEEVKEDVRRIKRLLGPCLIVSPSHEALLPNVPPQNVQAMAEATLEP